MSENNMGLLTLSVVKSNPKPDAPQYIFRTLNDIATTLNEENVDRFLSDFGDAIKQQIAFRELCYTVAKIEGISTETPGDKAKIYSFEAMTWIDD